MRAPQRCFSGEIASKTVCRWYLQLPPPTVVFTVTLIPNYSGRKGVPVKDEKVLKRLRIVFVVLLIVEKVLSVIT